MAVSCNLLDFMVYTCGRSLLGRAGNGRSLFSPGGQGLFFARPFFMVENLIFFII